MSLAVEYTSESTLSGFWSNTSIWTHVPEPEDPLFPANSGADSFMVSIIEPVTLNVNVTISSLNITSGSQLDWIGSGGATLTLDAGPISNAGIISLNENDALGIGGFVTLDGDGITELTAATSRIRDAVGGTLQVNGHTIRGQGIIGSTTNFDLINNGGLIVADVAGQSLTLDPGVTAFSLTNGGVFRATNGATLRLNAGTFSGGGGTFEAQAGSFVDLSLATINLGTLTSVDSGLFRVIGGTNRLNGVTLAQGTQLEVQPGKTLNLAGDITNNGQIKLITSATLNTFLGIDGAVTLAGAGMAGNSKIVLDDLAAAQINPISTDAVLIQQGGHTIEGTGRIGSLSGMPVENGGLIHANQNLQTLRLYLAGGEDAFVNSGILLASGGGVLDLRGRGGSVINNARGLIQVDDGSMVTPFNLKITGGELRRSSVSSSIVANNVTYQDLLHAATTDVLLASLDLAGVIDSDVGIINVRPGAYIFLAGDTTLTGAGFINLDENTQFSGRPSTPPFTLTNTSHFISGEGLFGQGKISVDNAATIDANVDGTMLTLHPAPDGSFTNTGTMQASDGGILFLRSDAFANNGAGVIRARNGSQVIIASGTHLTLDQEAQATIRADANATVEVRGNNVVITGGKLVSNAPGGVIDETSRIRVFGSEPRFHSVANEGFLLVDAGHGVARDMLNNGLIRITGDRSLILENTLTLDDSMGSGAIEVTGEGGTFGSVLRIRDAVTVDGSGAITLSGLHAGGAKLASIFGTGTDPQLTNQVTIIGEGRIGGGPFAQDKLRVVNTGDIVGTGMFDIQTSSATAGFDFINDGGNVIARDGGLLQIYRQDFNNKGRIVAESGSTIVLNDSTIDAAGASGAGGTIVADNGTVILDELPPPTIGNIPTVIRGGALRSLDSGFIVNPTVATLDGSAGGGPVFIEAEVFGANGSTTTISGTLTFDLGGSISLLPEDKLTRLLVSGTTTLNGTGTVNLLKPTAPGGLARIAGAISTSPVLTIGPGVTIADPGGEIRGGNSFQVVNQGMIVAPGAGSTFDLVSLPITNTGTLKAEGGATLRLDNAQVTNTDGTIHAEDGSVVELDSLTTIQGGVLETTGTGVIRNVGSAGLLLPIQNRGLFETADGANTGIVGSAASPVSLINSGTVKLASTGTTTRLEIIDKVRFTGSGVVELGDNPDNLILGSGAGTPELINSPRHTIRGAGSITGLGGGSTPIGFTNNGSVIADADNPLILDVNLVNNGNMKATGSGGLVMNGNRSKNVGTIQVDVGSQLDMNLGPVGLDNEGTVSIDGSATGSVFNKGSGTVGGSGTLNGFLLNKGRAKPTPAPGSDSQTGLFMLDGDLEQQGAEAVLDIGFEEVIAVLRGGASAHSVLHVTGHVTLDGSLALTRIAGFEPADGESFAILTFASRTGTFQTVTGMAAGGGNVFRVQYNPNDVTVVVGPAAAADLDQDGDVDADDFLTLEACVTGPAVPYDPQNLPAGCALSADPDGFIGADFNRDGDVDLGDLSVAQICQSGQDVPADPACPAP